MRNRKLLKIRVENKKQCLQVTLVNPSSLRPVLILLGMESILFKFKTLPPIRCEASGV